MPQGQVNGQPAFPQSKPSDVSRIGTSAIAGDSAIVDDFITRPGNHVVLDGGNLLLAGGMDLDIYPPLRVYRATDGKQFELMETTPQRITISPADAINPRIDVIYARLDE